MAFWRSDDGTKIHYLLYGDSRQETLVLLPGMLGAIDAQWRSFVASLSDHFQLLLIDPRGHGLSTNTEPRLLPEIMVADLMGVLDHLELKQVYLAGYDLGGYLGYKLHLEDPRRIVSLVLHATKFYWSQGVVESMREQLQPDRIVATLPEYANRLAHIHGGTQWRILVRQVADLITYLFDHGFKEDAAGKAQARILVSVGDRDRLISVEEAHRLSQVVPKGSLLVMPDVTHQFQSIKIAPFVVHMLAFLRS